MKKILPVTAILVVLAIGAYFLFFYDQSEPNGNENGTEDTRPGPIAPGDSTIEDEQPSELEVRREKLLKEHARPDEFVQLSFDYKKNLLGETIVEGQLTNNAELTTYRDFQLMVYFDDSESDVLDSASQVVFAEVKPGAKTDFKLKHKGPRRAKSIRLKLSDAKVVQTD